MSKPSFKSALQKIYHNFNTASYFSNLTNFFLKWGNILYKGINSEIIDFKPKNLARTVVLAWFIAWYSAKSFEHINSSNLNSASCFYHGIQHQKLYWSINSKRGDWRSFGRLLNQRLRWSTPSRFIRRDREPSQSALHVQEVMTERFLIFFIEKTWNFIKNWVNLIYVEWQN